MHYCLTSPFFHLHTNKRVTLLVAVDIIGVDVVRVGVIVISPQDDSGVIVTKNIRVSILKISMIRFNQSEVLRKVLFIVHYSVI